MKTYTYSYQNVKKPGLCRGREAGRGRLRTPAKLAGYPKGPECTYHGRGVLNTPTKRATGPNGWTPDMIIRPVPGRLVGRMQYAPTRVPAPTNQRGAAPNKPTPTGPQGPNGTYPARPYSTASGTRPPPRGFAPIVHTPGVSPAQGFALGYGTPGLQPGRVQGSAL